VMSNKKYMSDEVEDKLGAMLKVSGPNVVRFNQLTQSQMGLRIGVSLLLRMRLVMRDTIVEEGRFVSSIR